MKTYEAQELRASKAYASSAPAPNAIPPQTLQLTTAPAAEIAPYAYR